MKKNLTAALLSAVLLMAVAVGAIVYDLKQEPVSPDITETAPSTSAPPEIIEVPKAITDLAYAYACQIMKQGNTKDIGNISMSNTEDMSLAAYSPSYYELTDPGAMVEIYDEYGMIFEIKLWDGAPSHFVGSTPRLTYIRETQFESDDEVGTLQSRFDKVVYPSLSLYMGYIIEDTGEGFVLRDKLGNTLFEGEDMPAVANTRDRDGIPLFIEENGRFVQVGYNGFSPSDYNDSAESRGLYFDYPSSYGISLGSIDIRSKKIDGENRYAYYEGEQAKTGYAFERAFGFLDEFAIAKGVGGGYSVISEDGSVLTNGTRYYTNSDLRRVKMTYLDPESLDIYSLGYYYFDNGLVRQRQVDTDFKEGYITLDKEILIYPDGSEFNIPSGFELVSYSEGILLLRSQNTGRYGMFSNCGEWIAQPVFDYAYPFVCGVAVLGFDSGYAGAIDKNGNVVIDFVYDYLSCCSSGMMLGYRAEQGWTLLCMAMK